MTSAIMFSQSTVDFCVGCGSPTPPAGQLNCTEKLINNLTSNLFNYFDTASQSVLSFRKVVYKSPWCPFIFANARLNIIEFDSLADSFLATNLFKFQQVDGSLSPINSTIIKLNLKGYNFGMDESLMHSYVFKRLQQLEVTGSVGSLQLDLFKSFPDLTQIWMKIYNLASFFHKFSVSWSIYFKKSQISSVTFTDYSELRPEWLDPPGAYTYPDKDLCIFEPIPLNSVVLIIGSNLTMCTDTVTWLTQNYNKSTYYQGSDFGHQSPVCWKSSLRSKQLSNLSAIKTKISECQLRRSVTNDTQSELENYKTYIDFYGFEVIFQFAGDLLAFVFIPFICILGLFLNSRVIYTVHKNSKVEFKEDFYKNMMINSVFNCIFCFIYVFYPINYCEMNQSGYFCSSIYNTVTAQVFRIAFIGFFGEAIKMCSNISYIFIAISRYMLVGQKHNSMLEKISKWEIKWVICITVVLSLLMNIGHAFQYKINWGYGEFVSNFQTPSGLYPFIVIYNSSLQVYLIVYFFINFVGFLIVNTCIEVSLFLNLRKEIAEKRAKLEKEIAESQSKNTSGSAVINKVNRGKQKKIDQDKKKETRAIVMVILNSVINFFLRLPELFVFVSSYYSFLCLLLGNKTQIISQDIYLLILSISSMILSFSYFFYIFTFTTNVVIYCVFNPTFKKHFIWWEYNVKSK
jgi:hypothetical protein